MKRIRWKGGSTFVTTLLACAAFLVGAVKIWGVSLPGIWSSLLMILAMVLVLMVLAFLLVVTVQKIRNTLKK